MAEHFKEVCSNCKRVIRQCRCPSIDKTIKYSICDDCLGNTIPASQSQQHINIAKIKDLTDRLNCILKEPKLGKFFWNEAVHYLMQELRDALDKVLDH